MNNEEKILGILEKMDTRLDKLEAGQAKLEAGQAEMGDRFGTLESGQVKMEQYVKEIRVDVKTIKREIKELYLLSDAAFTDILKLSDRTENLENSR